MNSLKAAIAEVRRRVLGVVSRAIILAVDDAKKLQELELLVSVGEERGEVERFQEYGFTSVPLPGAEAVVLWVGGRRDHGLAIGVEDRRYRTGIGNLDAGETAQYNHTGAKVVIRANGDVEITPKSGQKLVVSADVEVTGTLTASVDVVGGGKHLATHSHSATLNLVGTTASPGSPLAGTATGSTGAPS